MFSLILKITTSLAAQTELILSALKTERNSKDSTEAWVQATLTQLIQSFKHPTEDSSNKQSKYFNKILDPNMQLAYEYNFYSPYF